MLNNNNEYHLDTVHTAEYIELNVVDWLNRQYTKPATVITRCMQTGVEYCD